MLALNLADRKAIVNLLKGLSEMTREQDRAILLEEAGFSSDLIDRIDLSGNRHNAATSIVRGLIKFGRPTPEAEALGMLLKTLKERLGVEQQQLIDSLIEAYAMLRPLPPQPAQAPSSLARPLPPQPAQALSPPALPPFDGDPMTPCTPEQAQELLRPVLHLLGPNDPDSYMPRIEGAGLRPSLLSHMRQRKPDPALWFSRPLVNYMWGITDKSYDPLERLLSHLRAQPGVYVGLTAEQQARYDQVLAQRQVRLAALRARAALAWLGQDRAHSFGAGVLLKEGRLLLTAARNVADPANLRARFACYDDGYWESVPTLSLTRDNAGHPRLVPLPAAELALLLLDQPDLPELVLSELRLGALECEQISTVAPVPGQRLYLWHHPGGRAAALALAEALPPAADAEPHQLRYSLTGLVDLPGGPIFNQDWQLVGIHLRQEREIGTGLGLGLIKDGLCAVLTG